MRSRATHDWHQASVEPRQEMSRLKSSCSWRHICRGSIVPENRITGGVRQCRELDLTIAGVRSRWC